MNIAIPVAGTAAGTRRVAHNGEEMGEISGVKTPYIDAVLALTRQMGEVAGVYPVYPAETHRQHEPEVASSPVCSTIPV